MAQCGKLDINELKRRLEKSNKNFKPTNFDITDVKDWIPTGSRWLDSIICKGKLAGIPVGKVVEIAGLESSGKSYMAAQIGVNAQKKDYNVIYFDSEVALDSSFLKRAGIDFDKFLYAPAESVEKVLQLIEDTMKLSERNLFIWDSMAFTPTESDIEGDFDPSSSMAVKARVLALGLSKLLVPLAETQSTLLVLNQLKENIPTGPNARIVKMKHPYRTPGGKSLLFAYSLRIWLTKREAKKMDVVNEKGHKIGNEVKATIKKSRFGTEDRVCSFQIIWGDNQHVGILDEESWLEAIKNSPFVESGLSWKIWKDPNDKEKDKPQFSFRASGFKEKLTKEPKFLKRILEIMDIEIIEKFDKQEEDAKQFYKLEDDS